MFPCTRKYIQVIGNCYRGCLSLCDTHACRRQALHHDWHGLVVDAEIVVERGAAARRCRDIARVDLHRGLLGPFASERRMAGGVPDAGGDQVCATASCTGRDDAGGAELHADVRPARRARRRRQCGGTLAPTCWRHCARRSSATHRAMSETRFKDLKHISKFGSGLQAFEATFK